MSRVRWNGRTSKSLEHRRRQRLKMLRSPALESLEKRELLTGTPNDFVPEAADDFLQVTHSRSFESTTGLLLVNDFDLDEDTELSAELVSDVAHGTLLLQEDGTFTYTPTAAFVGMDSFRYRITDGIYESDAATVWISIENATPRSSEASFRLAHDNSLTVDAASGLASRVADADDDPLAIEIVAQPTRGVLTHSADGSFTYTPDVGFVGVDSFIYRVDDGVSPSVPATVRLEVYNHSPHLGGDFYTVAANASLSVPAPGILANDVDAEQDVLAASIAIPPTNGVIVLAADGGFVYSPNPGFTGTETIVYSVTDGPTQQFGTLSIAVTGGASSPTTAVIATPDIYSVVHGKSLSVGRLSGVLANDQGPTAEWLDAQLVVSPTHGSLVLAADGSFAYVPADPGFVGTDSFSYQATDGAVTSTAATVTIFITNSQPTAGNLTLNIHQGGDFLPSLWSLSDLVSDSDNDTLEFEVVAGTTHGTAVLGSDGDIDYVPNPGFVGLDSLEYRVFDGAAYSSTATLVFAVTNTAPEAIDRSFTIKHDESLVVASGGLVDTAHDVDQDELSAEVVSQPTHGTLSLEEDGTFTYVPNAGFVGSDSFDYRVFDGAEYSLAKTVEVHVENSGPVTFGGQFRTRHGQSLSRPLAAWDADGDELTYELRTAPSHGSVTLSSTGFLYTPDADFSGSDQWSYIVSDGVAESEEAVVSVSVTNVAPMANDRRFRVAARSGSLNVAAPGLLSYAVDLDNDPISLSPDSVTPGQVTLDHGTLTVNSDGSWSYFPLGTSAGIDTFTYRITDGAAESAEATITIEVTNFAPIAVSAVERRSLNEGVVVAGSRTYTLNIGGEFPLALDGDQDALTYSLVGTPSLGSATISPAGEAQISIASDFVGDVVLQYTASDGIATSELASLTLRIENDAPYPERDFFSVAAGGELTLNVSSLLRNDLDVDGDTPELAEMVFPSGQGSFIEIEPNAVYRYLPGSFSGTAVFQYRVTDGVALSDWAEVAINVYATAPWAAGRAYQIYENETLEVEALSERGDAWDLEGFGTGPQVSSLGSVTVSPDGAFSYQGTSDVEVRFGVSDGLLNNDQNGDGVLDARDTIVSFVDVVADSSLLAWDTPDVDEPSRFINCGPTGQSETPSHNNVAQTVFACLSSPGPNTAPAAIPDVVRTTHGRPVSHNLLANDLDPNHDQLAITRVLVGATEYTLPFAWESELGLIEIDSDGSLEFDSLMTAIGRIELRYVVSDGLEFDTVSARIDVSNDAPLAINDGTFVAGSGQVITGNLLANDYDPDGDPLVIRLRSTSGLVPFDPQTGSLTVALDNGALTLNIDGNFSFAPNAGFGGDVSFTYEVTDGLDSDSQEVKLSYVNRAPVADTQRYIRESTAAAIAISPTFPTLDMDGDTLTTTVDLAGATGGGVFSVDPQGGYSFQPPSAEWTGTASLTYTITDPNGATATGEILVEVRSPNPNSSNNLDAKVVAHNDTLAFLSSLQAVGNVLSNDTSESVGLTASGGGAGAFGSLAIQPDGTAVYTLTPGRWEAFAKSDGERFTYRSTDSQGNHDTGEVWIRPFVLQANSSASNASAIVENIGSAGIKMTLDGPRLYGEGGSYAINVLGVGGADATAYWFGDASELQLGVDGAPATPVIISGALRLFVDNAGQDVVGDTVTVYARYSLNEILGHTAVNMAHAGEGTIKRVLSPNNIGIVHAGHLTTSMVDTVRAGLNVKAVNSGGNVGKIWAGQSIGYVRANHNVVGSIRAEGGSIGFMGVTQSDFMGTQIAFNSANVGVTAGGSIQRDISAGGSIRLVQAYVDVTDYVDAGANVLRVKALTGSLTDSAAVIAGGRIGLVKADGSIQGSVSALSTIGVVEAGESISQDVTASLHISAVVAGESLTGDVVSSEKSITQIIVGSAPAGGSIVESRIFAGEAIGRVTVGQSAGGGNVSDSQIIASRSFLGRVTVAGGIDAHIEAGKSIGAIHADQDIAGVVWSRESFVDSITAEDGAITAELEAKLQLGPVRAQDSISGNISASRITSIESTTGSIASVIEAIEWLGSVTAAGDITQTITVGELNEEDELVEGVGNIGQIVAGLNGQGNVGGLIRAGNNIHSVVAIGDAAEVWEQFSPNAQSLYESDLLNWKNSGVADASTMPIPPRPTQMPVATSGGSIKGAIQAGGWIGFASADQDIEQTIEAAKNVNWVVARRDVLGTVKSGAGTTAVSAGGSIDADIFAVGGAFASSYDGQTGRIEATAGPVVVDTWGHFTGSGSGDAGIFVYAYGAVNGGTAEPETQGSSPESSPSNSGGGGTAASANGLVSQNGPAFVSSLSTVSGSVTASRNVAIGAFGKIDGNVISHNGNALLKTVHEFQGAVTAKQKAAIVALNEIEADVIARQGQMTTYDSLSGSYEFEKSTRIYVRNAVTADIHVDSGSAFVNARSISGSITVDDGSLAVLAFGDVAATLTASENIVVMGHGGVSGAISSENGGLLVVSHEDIQAMMSTDGVDKAIVIATWGGITGEGTISAPHGSVDIAFAYGDIEQSVHAGQHASVSSWRDIKKPVTADNGNATLFAGKDVLEAVTAGKNVAIKTVGSLHGRVEAGTLHGTEDYLASIIAIGDVLDEVVSHGSVSIESLGKVTSDVVAANGDASVSALGDYRGNINSGRDIQLSVGGTLDGSVITAGRDVKASAHLTVEALTINAERHGTLASDTSIYQSSLVAGKLTNGIARVTSLGIIDQVEVESGDSAHVVAGESALDLEVRTTTGDLEVVAVGSLQGEFAAGRNAFVSSLNTVLSQTTVSAATGSATIYGANSVHVQSATSQVETTVHSYGSIQGSYDSNGSTTAVSGTHINATVKAHGDVDVFALHAISGGVIESRNGSAFVGAAGLGDNAPEAPMDETQAGIHAPVKAGRNATVITLSGSIVEKVTATLGNATLYAADHVEGGVSAGKQAVVVGLRGVTDLAIESRSHASVESFGPVSSRVQSTKGAAIVQAGDSVTGEVTAALNAIVESLTGGLTADITSQKAHVLAISAEEVTGNVSAAGSVLLATLASVSGDVTTTSGDALVLAAGGGVSGTIETGRSALVLARNNLTGSITAGRDALAATLESVLAPIEATRDAIIVAAGTASSSLTAGRHAVLIAFDTVTTTIEATLGDVILLTAGGVANSVAAGRDVLVVAGLGGAANASGRDIFIVSGGELVTYVDAARDAVVTSLAGIAGNIDVERDAVAVAGGSSTVAVSASRDGLAYGFEGYRGTVIAGRDAAAFSWGLTEGSVIAGRDAVNWSYSGSGGAVMGGRYALGLSWGVGFGPLTVHGNEGAFAWTYENCQCFVTSADGWAGIASYDDVVGNVDAAGDAFVWLLGDFNGDVDAGDSAAVVAHGGYTGAVTAGSDAAVIALGAAAGSVDANRDGLVYSHGNVTSSLETGRDAGVWTYGEFSGSVAAGRDVVQVWTVGHLAGTITADRNIGVDDWTVGGYGEFPDIFSHGAISATISASNPQNLPDGGLVGRVVAAGGIGGSLTAATAILQVRSGAQVTAVINAPLVGSVIEFDGTVATEYPAPSLPPSFVDELLADAAEVFDLATSWRVSLAAELATAVNDLTAARDEAADELAELRDEHDERVDELLTKRELAKIQGLASADAERISQRNLLLDQFTQQKTQADETLAEIEAARDDLKAQRQANFDSFAAQREEILDLMAEVHVEFAEQRIERGVVIDQLITLRDSTWTALYVQTAPQSGFDQSEFNLWDYAPTMDAMLRMSLVPGNPLLASLYYGTTLISLRGFSNGVTSEVASTLTMGSTPDFHLFGGQDDPYYDGAFWAGKLTAFAIITLGSGGLGASNYVLTVAGKAVPVGKAVRAFDWTSNLVQATRNSNAIFVEKDYSVGNFAGLALNVFGVLYNAKGVYGDASGVLKGIRGGKLAAAADVAPSRFASSHAGWSSHIDGVVDDIVVAGRPKIIVLGEGGQGSIRSFVNREPSRMTEFLEMRPAALDYSVHAKAIPPTLTPEMNAETLEFNLLMIERLHQRGFSFKVIGIKNSASANSPWLKAELEVLERLGVKWDVIPISRVEEVLKMPKWR
jgi:hypothetical protein